MDKTIPIALRMSKETRKDLKILATEHETTMGDMIQKLIDTYNDKQK